MQSNEKSAIVIGGGVAGLASSAFLARQSFDVRLFEQATALGGRARTKEQDGFYFNIGPHALYRAGAGLATLRELGVEPKGSAPRLSGAFAVRDNATHKLPANPTSLLATSLFSVSEKMEMARLLAGVTKIDSSPWMNSSVSQWVEAEIKREPVREFLLALLRLSTYINAPERLSAGSSIEQLKRAVTGGVLYLDEGWQTLVDGLSKSAESVGVKIETGARAVCVERDSQGAVKSVRMDDGSVIEASTIIIASSPQVAASLVESSSLLDGWSREAMAVKAACLDIALDRLPVPKTTFALGIDQPLYFSVHSAVARLAPTGGALIHVAKYLPTDCDASEEDEHELESLLDLLQPRWRERVAHRRFLPDMTVMHAIPEARCGAVRPGPEVADTPGLFVAGDWVGREGLLVDASLASAKEAARLAIEAEGKSKKAKVGNVRCEIAR
jgi:phytoene dehydrogenase-like protein